MEKTKRDLEKGFTLDIVVLILAVFIAALYFHYWTAREDSNITSTGTENGNPQSKYREALDLAGEWFLNNQDDDFVHYLYDPVNNTYENTSQPLRQIAAVWGLATLYKYSNDTRYKSLAEKGLRYFEKKSTCDNVKKVCIVNAKGKEVKLGNSAFMILSILELNTTNQEYYLEGFANSILLMQNQDGSYGNSSTNDTDWKNFYPGEAMLSLMSLYNNSKNTTYLTSVGKALKYYKAYFRKNPSMAFVPWQSRAYASYYKATGSKEARDFVLEMNNFLINKGYPKNHCSGFHFAEARSIGVYIEGMNFAYEIAKDMNYSERKECYSNYILEGADYIITQQIKDQPNTIKEAIGGIPSSTGTIRIDNNQHAVMALVGAIELGILN